MPQGASDNHNAQRESIKKNTASKKNRRRRRKPAVQFRLSMVVFIWLICLISCFAAYMIGQNLFPDDSTKPESSQQQSDSLQQDDDTAEIPHTDSLTESSAAPSVSVKNNPVPAGTVMSADYLKKCAFLGDSNVFDMGQNALLDALNVYSSEALTLENYGNSYISVNGSQLRLIGAVSGASCPIYLMFGTDSLADASPEDTADRFSVLLNAVKNAAPAADIFVLAAPPVTATAEFAETPVTNADIDAYNSMLLSIANSANVYFVDTNTALKNNESKLDATFAAEDGIHLNKEGGRKLLDYVLCHVPA